MTGWLIVNSFLKTQKFNELYGFLLKSANEQGVELTVKNGVDLLCELSEGITYAPPDFAIFWDKDIYLAKMLEGAGVRLFNSASAVEICDNKILTALTLNKRVKTPKTVIAPKTFENVGYCDTAFLQKAVEILGLPLIIKEAYGSFGQQVYLANSIEEAQEIVEKLGHKEFLMQQFIASSKGVDLRVNVVGERVVSCILRQNLNDFRSNVSGGGSASRYQITAEQEAVAISACRAIGLDFAGVDLLFGENGEPIVCEVNSNVHFKSTFDCTKRDMSADIISHVIKTMKEIKG